MYRICNYLIYTSYIRFTPEELGPFTAMRNSSQKQLRTEAIRQFPFIEPYADSILPKKQQVFCSKWYAAYFKMCYSLFGWPIIFIHAYQVALFININYCIFSTDHSEMFVNSEGEVVFFKPRDGPIYPSLRLLNKCMIYNCILIGLTINQINNLIGYWITIRVTICIIWYAILIYSMSMLFNASSYK